MTRGKASQDCLADDRGSFASLDPAQPLAPSDNYVTPRTSSEIRVIPSIESPAESENVTIPLTPNTSTSNSPLGVHNSPATLTSQVHQIPDLSNLFGTISILDTLKEARLSPPSSSPRLFQFGDPKETSPFTFHKLYNTTPEPPRSFEELHPQEVEYSTLEVNGPVQHIFKDPEHSFPPSELDGHIAMRNPTVKTFIPLRARYDVNDERPPHNEPYFNAEFQTALTTGKNIAGKIEETLRNCQLAGDPESQVHKLIQTANELRSFDTPAVCTIGFVGDSGVGKSSLINSLLDETDLALTAGMGAACTSIVTEYRHCKSEHTAKYTVEVDRMTDEEIHEQIRELLWSYRQYHLSDINDMNATADEQKKLEEQSKVAYITLEAAFGCHTILTEEFLRDATPGAVDNISNQLKVWTSQISWPPGITHTANTAQECLRKMDSFLTGDLWPFIKIIRVYLNSQILKSGAVLADLPGFHDSNHARVKAAETYIYDCDEIFVVAEISRVSTNKSVEKILDQSLGKDLKLSRPSQGISLVCTKSEDFDEEEVKSKFFKGSDVIKRLEEELEAADLNDHLPGALRQRDQAQDHLNFLLMNARNDFIKKLVQQTYSTRLKDRRLSIFCVSNKLYKKHRNRPRAQEWPMKGSGIPTLRGFCHTIPARAQSRVAEHYLSVRVKALVHSIQLWLTGASEPSLPNNQSVQHLLDNVEDDLKENILDLIISTKEAQNANSTKIVIRPMKARAQKWTTSARKVAESWDCLHQTQVAAFCRNYGSWGSGKVSYTEWSCELIEAMVNDLLEWWDELGQSSTETLTELGRDIIAEIEELSSKVEDFDGAQVFAESLSTKIDSIRYLFENVETAFESALESMKRDATQNHADSYVFAEMSPAYRQCSSDRGPGVNQRRLALLRQAIGTPSNPTLFANIRRRLEKALSNVFSRTSKYLQREVQEILEQIIDDLEMLRGSEVQVLGDDGYFLEELKAVVEEVLEEMEIIKGVLSNFPRIDNV